MYNFLVILVFGFLYDKIENLKKKVKKKKKNIYSRMYNTDFEDHPLLGDKFIKPTSI